MNSNQLLKHLAAPLLLIALILTVIATIRYNLNKEIISLIVFVATFIYLILLERIIPLKLHWKTYRKDRSIDLKHLISTGLFDALGKAVALSTALYIQKSFFHTNDFWENIPFVFTFLAANVMGEFLPYVYHRVSHKGNETSVASLFLWKVHAIHHIPESMNWFKTNWMHPVNMVLNSLLKFGPLYLLGFNQEVIFSVGLLHVVIAYLSHANIDIKTGLLDYLIVTPKVHHFHHSKELEEAKNYGNILPIWDLICGTYYNRKGQVEHVGIVSSTYNYPDSKSFIKQFTFPLQAYKNCCMK